MKIYFISPLSATSPGLFETFPVTFNAKGHNVVLNVRDADVVFFDSHSGYLPYDWNDLNYVLENKIPVVYFDAFDYHCDSSKHWFGFNDYEGLQQLLHQDWAAFLNQARQRCRLVYFMRKMQSNADYGSNVYPLELIQFPDHDFPLTSKEELSSRRYDACFIGAKSTRREKLINTLQSDGRFNIYCQWTEERIPHDKWLDRHRDARFFIEADGGGLGSERPYQLTTIAPMLKQVNLQVIHQDWMAGIDCMKINTEENTDIALNALLYVLSSPDTIYDIYLKGVDRLKKYFNPTYRTSYILNILKENNIQ